MRHVSLLYRGQFQKVHTPLVYSTIHVLHTLSRCRAQQVWNISSKKSWLSLHNVSRNQFLQRFCQIHCLSLRFWWIFSAIRNAENEEKFKEFHEILKFFVQNIKPLCNLLNVCQLPGVWPRSPGKIENLSFERNWGIPIPILTIPISKFASR